MCEGVCTHTHVCEYWSLSPEVTAFTEGKRDQYTHTSVCVPAARLKAVNTVGVYVNRRFTRL